MSLFFVLIFYIYVLVNTFVFYYCVIYIVGSYNDNYTKSLYKAFV